MKILTNYDFNQNEIQNAALQRLASAPATPIKGQVYFNTTSNRLFYYNGTEWIGADAAGATITASTMVSTINGASFLIDDDNLSPEVNLAITKTGLITVSNAIDLDALNTAVGLNTTKVTNATHTGDVTGSTALTIANKAVTNAKSADMATKTLKGRKETTAGVSQDLTVAEVLTMLGVEAGANNYSHPNHTGDVTSSGDGATSIVDKKVTLSKLADISTASLLGRKTASSGTPEVLSKTDVLSILNVADGANNYTHPNHTGDVTSASDGATTIANKAVTNAKMADVPTNTIKGRNTAGSGVATDLTTAQVRTMLNIADGANNYSHPNHSGDVTSVADGATTIGDNKVTNAKLAQMAQKTLKGNKETSAGNAQDLTATEVRALLNVADGANNYVHPNHSGDVTSTGDGATVIGADKVTNAKLANMPTMTIKGNNTASTADPIDLTATQVRALLNVEDGAQVNTVTSVAGKQGLVSLISSDVGLGSVTNNAQVKKSASSVNGNIPTWNGTTGDALNSGYGVETTLTGDTSSIPRADAVKNYIDALLSANDAMIFKGTVGTGGTFTITDFNALVVYNAGWTYKVITAGTIKGHVCEVGDMLIATVDRASGGQNSDWTTIQTNIDGAVTGPTSATSNNFPLFDGVTGKLIKNSSYNASSFATAGHNHDSVYPKKYVTTLGGSVSQVVTHNLNTRDLNVTIRETASPYAEVITDNEATTLNTLTVKFAVAPTAGQYTITITG